MLLTTSGKSFRTFISFEGGSEIVASRVPAKSGTGTDFLVAINLSRLSWKSVPVPDFSG
jgi:hypothetical protein